MPSRRIAPSAQSIAPLSSMQVQADAVTRAWVREQRAYLSASSSSDATTQSSTQNSSSNTPGPSQGRSAASSLADALPTDRRVTQSRKRRAADAAEGLMPVRQVRRLAPKEGSASTVQMPSMPPPQVPDIAPSSHVSLVHPPSTSLPTLHEVLRTDPMRVPMPIPDGCVAIHGRRGTIACQESERAFILSTSRAFGVLNRRCTVWADGREVSATVRILRAYLRA